MPHILCQRRFMRSINHMIELFIMVSDFQDVAEVRFFRADAQYINTIRIQRNVLEQYALEKINENESDALRIV